MKNMKNTNGFTMVELLIVVSIIILLAILAVVALTSSQQRSRDIQRVSDMTILQSSLELYWNQNANYPAVTPGITTWNDLQEALSQDVKALPLDPHHKRGAAYTYLVNPDNTDEFVVATTLENGTQSSLNSDVDGIVGVDWVWLNSQGDSALVGANGFDCGDPVYCVEGESIN